MTPELPEASRQMAVSFITTEHFTLQGFRAMTITESNGRASLFLSSLSSALVALGFAATASNFGQSFSIFALLILPPIAFLGFITFQRTIRSGIDDQMYRLGISRIRRFYLETVPELSPYLIGPAFDDRITSDILRNRRGARWQSFLTIASVVGVMNSVVIGGIIGIVANLPHAIELPFALTIGVVVAIVMALAHASYQVRQWRTAFVAFSSLFPSEPSETPDIHAQSRPATSREGIRRR